MLQKKIPHKTELKNLCINNCIFQFEDTFGWTSESHLLLVLLKGNRVSLTSLDVCRLCTSDTELVKKKKE